MYFTKAIHQRILMYCISVIVQAITIRYCMVRCKMRTSAISIELLYKSKFSGRISLLLHESEAKLRTIANNKDIPLLL